MLTCLPGMGHGANDGLLGVFGPLFHLVMSDQRRLCIICTTSLKISFLSPRKFLSSLSKFVQIPTLPGILPHNKTFQHPLKSLATLSLCHCWKNCCSGPWDIISAPGLFPLLKLIICDAHLFFLSNLLTK